MKVVIDININKERPPYIERIFQGSELVSERPANVMAYYDVSLKNTGEMSIFSVELTENQIVQFDECDFVFSDNEYPLRKYLMELKITEDKTNEIMEMVINEINQLYYAKKGNSVIEVNV